MSRSGKRRISKWDLKDGSDIALESMQNDRLHEDLALSFHDNKTQTRWDSQKGGNNNGDENYSMTKSPGLNKWGEKKQPFSPKRSRIRSPRERSRSRSPDSGFKWESNSTSDRNRSKSGVPNQLCRDFSFGDCRRGDRCHFLHNTCQDYRDRRNAESGLTERRENRLRGGVKYSSHCDNRDHSTRNTRFTEYCNDYVKGRCRKGESCRYVHDCSDGSGRYDRNEIYRDRSRVMPSERVYDRESRRSGDIPCRFYAVGNCRNGNQCRFSHHIDERSRTVLESVNISEVDNGKMIAPEIGDNAQSTDNRFDCASELLVDATNNYQARGSIEDGFIQHLTENTDSESGVSKSLDTKWHGDMEISPERNSSMKYPNDAFKKETDHKNQNPDSIILSKSCTTIGDQICPVSVLQPTIFEKSFYQHNPNSRDSEPPLFPPRDKFSDRHNASPCLELKFSDDLLPCSDAYNQYDKSSSAQPPSILNVDSQNPPTILPSLTLAENAENFQSRVLESKEPNTLMITCASQIPSQVSPTSKMIGREEVAQLTNLSASLAHLLGSRQQLPQLYATLNFTSMPEIVPAPHVPGGHIMSNAITPIGPNQSIGSQKQHDLICDNIEPIKPGEVNKSNEIEDEENKNNEETRNKGALSSMDGNGKDEEGKKTKGIRAFKFALVEFIKEILKPSWKDGNISKEAYKIIVKRVVDKVTSTMQGAHVPQTEEKIKSYLSVSKSKLTKVVHAYVEKYQKS